ncbi:MAG TPA: hypothetical protein VGA98_07440 [Allosphingosinicella sp.]|jgi:hypothetical protein
MPRKLNLRTITGLAAALAMAGLSGAASAQRLNEPRPECMAEVRAYCATYWQYFRFASEQACVEAYTEQCHYEWSNEYAAVSAVTRQNA